ncbi:MAG: SusC/RagA family TonB-linked outer membrane protein [Flavobacterium sp.]|nr:MAG: SusC/RagA family TonB-linked outer membrane protein [Flavobacterium sp.]
MKTLYKKLLLLLLTLPFSVLAQSTLSGTVTDKASGQPLPGVNVVVEGSNNGVSTDFDGKYSLTNVKVGETVTFSYIGYKNASVKFTGQASQDISLEEDANQLQEVVVQVGYGSVKKKDATGSVTVIGTKDFNKGANVTVENLLNGRVAGVTINTSGAPGSGSQIRIRGGGSLFAANDPLIVVDGVPITNNTNTGSASALSAINPNDIESFTVLKDASSTAIYGSRASNGVIIITTKKGSKNLAVDYNFLYGSGSLVKKVDVFNANEFRSIVNEVRPGLAGQLGTANTDWQNEIYHRTDYVDNNLSIRGELFKAIPMRLSIGNTFQEGLRLTNTYTRNTISTALNPSFFTDHLKVRVNATYSNERNRFADGVEGAALRFDPTQPVYDATSPYGGFFQYYNGLNQLDQLAPKNPVAQLLQTNDSGRNNRIYGNVELDYKLHFFPDLRAVVNAGFDEQNGERIRLVGAQAGSAPSNGGIPYGEETTSDQTIRNKLLDAYLVYNKTFGKLGTEITAGYSYQVIQGSSFSTGNVREPNHQLTSPQFATDVVTIGFFGRANFTYNDKYLLTASLRHDGTSRFSEDNRWGNFPALAFAWKAREDFFKDSKTVSEFKLRLGYGITGQQEIPVNKFFLQQYVTGTPQSQYYFGNEAIPIAVSTAYNPNLKWETTTTYNVGADLGLFSRVNTSLDLFYKKTNDLFVNAPFADATNFSNFGAQNVGSFTTRGAELNINADILKSDKVNLNVNFNVTKFERRIDELALHSDFFVGDTGAGTGGTVTILREGYTPNSFFVYKQLYDADSRPIEGAYADLNGDGTINGDDRYIYKNSDPDATFGFAMNLNVGNFDLSFNSRASVGNRVFNAVNAGRAQYDLLASGTALGNIPRNVLTTDFNATSDVVLSDRYIENASWLKLDNVVVGYTFPKWLEGTSSLRLYLGVRNAFVWTKYSGLDPEITNLGIDNTIYPRERSILFGANVKF